MFIQLMFLALVLLLAILYIKPDKGTFVKKSYLEDAILLIIAYLCYIIMGFSTMAWILVFYWCVSALMSVVSIIIVKCDLSSAFKKKDVQWFVIHTLVLTVVLCVIRYLR